MLSNSPFVVRAPYDESMGGVVRPTTKGGGAA
jgi:hypothetical protein